MIDSLDLSERVLEGYNVSKNTIEPELETLKA